MIGTIENVFTIYFFIERKKKKIYIKKWLKDIFGNFSSLLVFFFLFRICFVFRVNSK